MTAAHLSRALDDLLDSGQQVTRALLGFGAGPAAGRAASGLPAPASLSGPGQPLEPGSSVGCSATES